MSEELRVDPTIAYDIVELPSQGMFYPSKRKAVRVGYLTATDENILSSQNLINSNMVMDELLKRKILDKDISVDEIIDEDKQAILLFLRNTAFGPEYHFTLTDPKTDEEFKVTVDLSEIKFKDFDLEADENGEFKYYMPLSKTNITFKFLTRQQQNEIKEIEKSWNGVGVAPIITKQLEFMIQSVEGNKDMMNKRNFIDRLPIRDSQTFRKFVTDNKPAIDLKRTVTAPSGENVTVEVGFGVEFFRPFYGL